MVQEIQTGRMTSLQSGHQPQFLVGLDANKPASPGLGDTYYATDTLRAYKCYVSKTWRWEWQGMSSGIRFSSDQLTIVQGTWAAQGNAAQTDYDEGLTNNVAGSWYNMSGVDLDEIKIPNLMLLPGVYLIELVTADILNISGILEILHGNTSIGTHDCGTQTANNVFLRMYYSITTATKANFRVRVNGKTGATWVIQFSRLEITRVSNSPVLSTLPPIAVNNAAAAIAGVPVGGLYRQNADPSIVYIRTA